MFCETVASRPPQDFGQLMAAHWPSCSRRCQAWRRSMVRRSALFSSPISPDAANSGRLASSQVAQLGAEGLVLGGIGEVHDCPTGPRLWPVRPSGPRG